MYLIDVLVLHFEGCEIKVTHWSDTPYGYPPEKESWWSAVARGFDVTGLTSKHHKDSGSAVFEVISLIKAVRQESK